MPHIIVPRRRIAQPRQPEVNRNLRAMDGVSGLWSFHNGKSARDLVTGAHGTAGNSTETVAVAEGVALASDEINWYGNFDTGRTTASCGISGGSPRTLFTYGRYNNSDGSKAYGVISAGAAGGVITDFAITRYYGGWRLQMWGTSGYDYVGTIPTDRAVLMVATYDGTTAELWIDGVRVVTGVPGTLSTDGSANVWINGWNNYYSGTGGGRTLYAGVLPRCWSSAEIALVSRAPFSVFAPDRTSVFFSTSQYARPISDITPGAWVGV